MPKRPDLDGEPAFQKILSWRAGNFEMLPAEPGRPRTIFKPYNALLLESAQAMDESRGDVTPGGASQPPASPLAQVSQIEGVEFVLALNADPAGGQVARGLENPEHMAAWARQSLERFRSLGDRLGAGSAGTARGLRPAAPRHAGRPGRNRVLCWLETFARRRTKSGS